MSSKPGFSVLHKLRGRRGLVRPRKFGSSRLRVLLRDRLLLFVDGDDDDDDDDNDDGCGNRDFNYTFLTCLQEKGYACCKLQYISLGGRRIVKQHN